MAGEHSLTRALRDLLSRRRTGALGTVGEDGLPFVSLVPYAIDTDSGSLVIHISGLAAHTRNLERCADASLMVSEHEPEDGSPVHALPRLTLQVRATTPAQPSPAHTTARSSYLDRFPDAAPMTELGDFRFVTLTITGARQVAGFGAARSLGAREVIDAIKRTAPAA
ncbi:pyridoxamine 5'-phosphate oxidase family protein [Hydrogenophaga sp. 5NK40-0174]|uniref:HugZ family pyridoxamine 5'-phosphate oxidase n=1 Tax=Hydrogenophaga sp. 5NK40-0174 TaxID=3127649 RepID=UPI003106B649